MDESTLKKPEEGVYIKGLFLEGAKWDYEKKIITQPTPRELFSKMPIIWLRPKENYVEKTTGIYKCPMYNVVSRRGTLSTTGHSTNFVMKVNLPSDREEDHWIK